MTYPEGTTPDIQQQVWDTYHASKGELRAFAEAWATELPDPHQRLRQLHGFVRRNIKYRLDPPGKQFVKTPSRTFADGFGDCKSYSIFLASVLYHWGIPAAFRYVSFKPGPVTHVYVVAYLNGRSYLLDACLPGYNTEKDFLTHEDVMTEIHQLSGIGDIGARFMSRSAHEAALKSGLMNERGMPRPRRRVTRNPSLSPAALELRCLRGSLRRQGKRFERIGELEAAAELYDTADFVDDALMAGEAGNLELIDATGADYVAGGYSLRRRTLGKGHLFKPLRKAQCRRQAVMCDCLKRREALPNIAPELRRSVSLYGQDPVSQYERDVISGIEEELMELEAMADVLDDATEGIEGVNGEYIGLFGRKRKKKKKKRGLFGGIKNLVNKVVDKAKDVAKGVWQGIKKLNPLAVLGRNSYLLLLRVNAFGWASKMGLGLRKDASQQNRDALERAKKVWKKFGGNPDKLVKAISKGMNKKPLLNKNARVSGIGYTGDPYIGEAVTLGAALASASAIIAAIKPILNLFKSQQAPAPNERTLKSGGGLLPEINLDTLSEYDADGMDFAADEPDGGLPGGAGAGPGGPGGDGEGADDKKKILGMPPWVVYAGGGVLLLGGGYAIYASTKTKRKRRR